MMRVKWEVTDESQHTLHLVARGVKLEKEDLDDLESAGLTVNERLSPNPSLVFFGGVHWGQIHLAMTKTGSFAGWQP